MKISTKGQYALESMLDMVVNDKEQESLKDIARRRKISENYLEQIFSTLRKAGLVASARGAQGGYRLARSAEDITAGDIIRAVEGALSPVKCVCEKENNAEQCPLTDVCVTKGLWADLMREINGTLDGITLADLALSYGKLNEESVIEFYI